MPEPETDHSEMKTEFPGERINTELVKGNRSISRKIFRVLRQIETEYYKKMDLFSLGREVGLNRDYLSRKFKREVGVTFQEYVQVTRVKKGAYLLANSEKSIKEVSHSVGFSRPEIFTRTFKKITGVTPKDFRTGQKRTVL